MTPCYRQDPSLHHPPQDQQKLGVPGHGKAHGPGYTIVLRSCVPVPELGLHPAPHQSSESRLHQVAEHGEPAQLDRAAE